jgi:polyhydroxybutyrate depolymerase
VCLHGRGTTPRWQAWISGLDRLAASRGALAVFPQGSIVWDKRGYAWDSETDVSYLADVIEAVRAEVGAPEQSVCLCGLSDGARMASAYAAARAEDVALLAAVAGLRAPRSAPARPVPVLAFHGLRDRAVPYSGGRAGDWAEGVEEAAAGWAAANGIAEAPVVTAVSPALSRTTYGAGKPGEVTLWTFRRAGHTWPGHPGGIILRFVLGATSRELDASEEIWRSFTAHRPG